MNGNGNDFVIINSIESYIDLKKDFIQKIACKNKGIGFDQLILISAPKAYQNDFFVKFYNADGGEALMCLNGIRCASDYIWMKNLAPRKEMIIETTNQVSAVKPAEKSLIEVSINLPNHYEDLALENSLKSFIKQPFFMVDSGNLHLCIKVKDINELNLNDLYEEIRALIRPYQMNISIYKIKNKEVVISTFENGVGKTLSCGSAAASIAFLETKNKQSLKVCSEGGFLNFFNANDKLVMRGPTKLDFDGVINE